VQFVSKEHPMSAHIQTKAAVTVAEMARMVGLSRSRFYQLIGTAFLDPARQPGTGRPVYTEELQHVCLEVRRRNCGIDGKPILFYARRLTTAPARPKPPKPKLEAKRGDVAALLDGLNALGLTTATTAQVQRVSEELFPRGTEGIDQGEVLRAVFLHLKRQNSADIVRR
jgi:hypothetical protein